MDSKIIFLTFCMLSSFMMSSPLWGSEKIAKLATLIDYSPFCFRKGNLPLMDNEVILPGSDSNILQGYSWDVTRESLHNQGYTIHLTVAPWKRSLEYMENNKVDALFPTSKNEKRLKKYYYAKKEINNTAHVVYVRNDSSIEWHGLESLHGKVIAVIRGWSYNTKWEEDNLIKKHPVNKQKQAFEMVIAKHVDGFAGVEKVQDRYLHEHEMTGKFKKLPPFNSIPEFLTGLKTNPRLIKILDAYDAGKIAIKQNGTLDKINEKWGISN